MRRKRFAERQAAFFRMQVSFVNAGVFATVPPAPEHHGVQVRINVMRGGRLSGEKRKHYMDCKVIVWMEGREQQCVFWRKNNLKMKLCAKLQRKVA